MKTNLNRALCSALPIILGLGLAGLVSAAKPAPKPPPPPAEDGMIRVRCGYDWYLMSQTAGGADLTLAPEWNYGELSRTVIGGQRWLLQARFVDGETYPNGQARYDVVASSLDGTTEVVLNSDPLLQPVYLGEMEDYDYFFFSPRWAGPAHVSWVARRLDSTGAISEMGIYTAALIFDDNGALVGAGAAELLPLPLTTHMHNDFGEKPLLRGYDWAPDGSALVYSTGYELVWAEPSGTTVALKTSTSSQFHAPRWSPVGDLIAFVSFSNIEKISPAGTNAAILVSAGRDVFLSGPKFSPSGAWVVYGYLYYSKTTNRRDIYKVPAAGGSATNLTGSTSAYVGIPSWE